MEFKEKSITLTGCNKKYHYEINDCTLTGKDKQIVPQAGFKPALLLHLRNAVNQCRSQWHLKAWRTQYLLYTFTPKASTPRCMCIP